MCHHNIARLRREALLHNYMKTTKINTTVTGYRKPFIFARNSIWNQQCCDRHVFSTHKALKPFALHTFSSLDGLICKQLEYFHSIQEKRQSYFTAS